MKYLVKIMLAALVMTCTSVTANEVKVILKKGRKVLFPSNGNIKLLDRNGSIGFTDRFGTNHSYRRTQLHSIETPLPNDVLALEKIFRSLDYEKVIDLSSKVSLTSMWTGWGARVYCIKALAQLNLGKYDDAAKTLRDARNLFEPVDGQKSLIKIMSTAVVYAQKGGSIIETPSSYAMLLNGLALEKKKNMREASLEYMKAMELYPTGDKDGVTNLDRLAAMSRLVEVLKVSKDMGTADKIKGELAAGR